MKKTLKSGCKPPENIRGGKGKIKLKNLFKENGLFYHEGKRAKELISSLDIEVLIHSDIVPLKRIDQLLFK